MTPEQRLLQFETRRHFFSRCGVGVGKIALASMLGGRMMSAATAKAVNPNAPKPPHFPPKVKNVIYLFMAGGPSQLELFDYKPALQQYDGKSAPESLLKGKRFEERAVCVRAVAEYRLDSGRYRADFRRLHG